MGNLKENVTRTVGNKRFLLYKLISLAFGICAVVCLLLERVPLIFACAAMAIVFSCTANNRKTK